MLTLARIYTYSKTDLGDEKFELIEVEHDHLDKTVESLVQNGYELMPEGITPDKYIDHIVEV